MARPILAIHADDLRDVADLMALGSSNISDIAHKICIDYQINNVTQALSKLNQLGREYSKTEEEIAIRVEDMFVKSANKSTSVTDATLTELADKRQAQLIKTQIHKDYWKVNERFQTELEKLVVAERYGEIVESIDEDTKNALYTHLIEERAGKISGISELNRADGIIKKRLGRERLFAIKSADKVIQMLQHFCQIARNDNFKKKKYNNFDLEEFYEKEDPDSYAWFRIPENYLIEIEIPSKPILESLLERINGATILSTRARVICFRKALKESRELRVYLNACDKKCQFSHGELDTVLQSISRFNAKVSKPKALRIKK